MSIILSEPISLDLTTHPRAWVYRLWNENGDCLYVGQHTGIHPATRIQSHRNQPWWNEVAGADYVEVLEGDLDIAEKQQIHDLNARYNDGGWKRLHPSGVDACLAREQRSARREQQIAGLVQRNRFGKHLPAVELPMAKEYVS